MRNEKYAKALMRPVSKCVFLSGDQAGNWILQNTPSGEILSPLSLLMGVEIFFGTLLQGDGEWEEEGRKNG